VFVRKVPPYIEWPEDDDPGDVETDPRVVEQQSRIDAAQVAYERYLAERDFENAGDLLAFFARDVFHESPLVLTVDGGAKQVRFSAESLGAYRLGSDGQRKYCEGSAFEVTFDDIVHLDVSLDRGGRSYGKYSFSEIDALDDRISAAQADFGGVFHSLTIQVGVAQFYQEGWIQLVFRSVRVLPRDPGDWKSQTDDPGLHIIGLLKEPDFLGSGAPA
jgi:hypothetical protein